MHILVQANGARLICIPLRRLGKGNSISIIFYQTGGSRIAWIMHQVYRVGHILQVNVHFSPFGKWWKFRRQGISWTLVLFIAPDHLARWKPMREVSRGLRLLQWHELASWRCKSPATQQCLQQFVQADNTALFVTGFNCNRWIPPTKGQ